MADIIPFPARRLSEPEPEAIDIDLITAVDVAIRDLRDIARALGEDGVRRQAEECRLMLERAFNAAV
jgi:hypothetical protein